MYVKVQRGQTIKKLHVAGAKQATVEQLLKPFRNMKLLEGGSDSSHYCLTLTKMDREVVISDDETLREVLQGSDRSTTVKLQIRNRSDTSGFSDIGSEEYEVVPAMEEECMGKKIRKLSLPSRRLGGYLSEVINIVHESQLEDEDKYGQSMIEVEELRLREIKEELLKTQENILRIERTGKLTDVRSLLDYAYQDLL